uniref:Transmembrane protein 70 n=1 Tax=Parascaris univalens TaxID=6257 RepID=A0A915BAS1_PARUN
MLMRWCFWSSVCTSSNTFANMMRIHPAHFCTACIRRCIDSGSEHLRPPRNLLNLHSIPPEDLGTSIMYRNESGRRISANNAHQILNKGVRITKMLSLSSSALGLVMVPILSAYLWDAASEQPSIMLFAVVANTFLTLLSSTPFLLQFLVKRFIVDIYYNKRTKVFTTIHYGFLLNKRALRFRVDDVVDAASAPEMKKLWLPLATVFVYGRPLLLSLDPNSYVDRSAFEALTKNVSILPGSD